MKKALVIIDVQNDYFPGGKCELFESEKALAAIKKLLSFFRTREYPVYFIQHVSGAKASFFAENTKGIDIHEQIEPLQSESICIKHSPNSFYETNLNVSLEKQGVTDLVICGMMTHMCVDTTVRAAKDYGYHVTLVSDACATLNLTWKDEVISAEIVQKVFLASLHGMFSDVISTEEFLKK